MHSCARALASLGLGVALAAPATAVRLQGHLRAGVEDVNLDRYHLRLDGLGNVGEVKGREGTLQNYLAGGVTAVHETDLGKDWIWDTDARFDFQTYSDLQVTSQRSDRFAGRLRSTVARPLPKDAYLSFELNASTYLEQFLPDLDATVYGFDAVYEREIRGDAYLQTRLGLRRGDIQPIPGDNYTEWSLTQTYEHHPPDRLRPEVLPFHKERRVESEWEFLLGHALNLDRARDMIRWQGDAPLLADMAPEPPLPQAWQGGAVRPRIGIRESSLLLGAQLIDRELDDGNAFVRGSAFAGIEWSLTDFLALTLRDTVALQDWRFPDAARIRSDRGENHFSMDLAYVKDDYNASIRLGLDSSFLDDFKALNYHHPHAGVYGSYDTGGKYRVAGFVRWAKDDNLDPRGDFPDMDRWDSSASLLYRFDDKFRFEFLYLREKVNIDGLQSEFDSSYLDRTYQGAFRRQLFGRVQGELGYKIQNEEHRIFEQNNRYDASTYFHLEALF